MEPAERAIIRKGLNNLVDQHRLAKDAVIQDNALWVQGQTCDVINGYLCDLKSDQTHPGTVYELTAVAEKSAYDLQFYLKINHHSEKPTIEDCGISGWKKVKGGPPQYRDCEGYLSSDKVRRLLQNCLRRSFDALPRATPQTPNVVYSGGLDEGKADTTFRLKRDFSHKYNVDVVAVIKATDLSNGQEYDLVAKPLDRDRPDSNGCCWRMSWSVQEKQLLQSFRSNKGQIRKLTLLKVIKLIKNRYAVLEKYPDSFYLNALFWLHERYAEDEYWTEEQFANRFIDMINLLRDSLGKRDLRVYFNDDINLLIGYSVDSALEFLSEIIEKQDYMSLIKAALD